MNYQVKGAKGNLVGDPQVHLVDALEIAKGVACSLQVIRLSDGAVMATRNKANYTERQYRSDCNVDDDGYDPMTELPESGENEG